jgi:hypothetical protein
VCLFCVSENLYVRNEMLVIISNFVVKRSRVDEADFLIKLNNLGIPQLLTKNLNIEDYTHN